MVTHDFLVENGWCTHAYTKHDGTLLVYPDYPHATIVRVTGVGYVGLTSPNDVDGVRLDCEGAYYDFMGMAWVDNERLAS